MLILTESLKQYVANPGSFLKTPVFVRLRVLVLFLTFRGQDNSSVITSVAFHENVNNAMIFAVSKDSKLRIWSASVSTLVLIQFVL